MGQLFWVGVVVIVLVGDAVCDGVWGSRVAIWVPVGSKITVSAATAVTVGTACVSTPAPGSMDWFRARPSSPGVLQPEKDTNKMNVKSKPTIFENIPLNPVAREEICFDI